MHVCMFRRLGESIFGTSHREYVWCGVVLFVSPFLAASGVVLSCLVWCCLVLPCLVLRCPALHCIALSCFVSPCLVVSCLVVSCRAVSSSNESITCFYDIVSCLLQISTYKPLVSTQNSFIICPLPLQHKTALLS